MTEWILLVLKWQSVFLIFIDPNFLLFADQLDASPLEGKKKRYSPTQVRRQPEKQKDKIYFGHLPREKR